MKPYLQNVNCLTPKPSKSLSPVTLQVLSQIFKTAPSPDIVTYTIFIKFLGHSGCAFEAFELFTFMKEYHEPDTILFTVLIQILCNSNMYDHALRLFYEMPNYNCRPDIICYNTLIDKLGEAGEEKLVQNLRFMMEAEVIHADVVTYSSILKSHCVNSRIDEALLVLRFMEMSSALQPNTYTYNTIIKAYLDRGHIKEALGVLGRMEIRGCKPDLCSFNLFIKHYSNFGQGLEAYMFLKSMVARGIEASQSSYRMCLYGLMKQVKVDFVLQVIEEIKISGVSLCVCSWNNLILWLGKMSRVDEAYSLFLGMQNPDEITMNIVIQMLYNHGRCEKAWETFCSMEERKIEASVLTYNIVLHGLGKEGNISKAFELLYKMEDEKRVSADIVTYNSLLNILCNNQEIEEACKLILMMLSGGCKPDLISINTLMKGMINAGRTKDASRLFEHVRGRLAAHSVPLRKLIEEMLIA
ncbi:hypothetical protein ACHQM5_004386 [Ranunculus cassubicifolius]